MRLHDLYEQEFRAAKTPNRLKATLPPTYMVPALVNSNGYPQYRHGLAMAAALAAEKGEVEWDPQSMWNQTQTVICYAPEELEILNAANKLMGVKGVSVTSSESHEPDWVNNKSPIMQNTHTLGESLRDYINRIKD
jgi:hypothetical protein